jgi:hypothetical protein
LIAVLAAAIGVAAFAVVSQAGAGRAGSEWHYKAKPNKALTPASTDSLIIPSYKRSDGSLAETKKTTIQFAPGTKFDTSVPPRCKSSGGELVSSNGASCKKAQIGKGDALSAVGSSTLAAELKAYNKKNGLFFLVIGCNPGTGPGQADPNCTPLDGATFALEGKLKYADKAKTKPLLVVPTPQTLIDGHIIITKFHLNTCSGTFAKKCKKSKKVNGKTVVRAFTFTPKKCKSHWTTKAKIEYTNEPSQTISDTQSCRK